MKTSNILIDSKPASEGKEKTQEDWIDYFVDHGRIMISAPNVYNAVLQKDILDSLRKDFKAGLITSTRLIYNPKNLETKIIHDYGSSIIKPKIITIEAPVFEGVPIAKALEGKGLIYAQALFCTDDNLTKIVEVLEELSQMGAERIRLWTPDQASRIRFSDRAAGFASYNNMMFTVTAVYDPINYPCRSRGVQLNSGMEKGS